jgi:hypothetical protein
LDETKSRRQDQCSEENDCAYNDAARDGKHLLDVGDADRDGDTGSYRDGDYGSGGKNSREGEGEFDVSDENDERKGCRGGGAVVNDDRECDNNPQRCDLGCEYDNEHGDDDGVGGRMTVNESRLQRRYGLRD